MSSLRKEDSSEKIDKAELEKEIVEVKKYIELAKQISVDNKTQELMKGLAIGFDNMKKVAQIKNPDERVAAEQQILSGKPADTVSELMKKHKSLHKK